MSKQRALLIAEKPSMARDIQSAYNNMKGSLPFEIDVMALRGYFVQLQFPGDYKKEWGQPWKFDVLPMIPEKFKYKVNEGAYKDFNILKNMVHDDEYDFVINACDAGREGQSIFWSFYDQANGSKPVKRIWVSDTTEEAYKNGLKTLRDEQTDQRLKDMKTAAFYRMHLDWLIGMNLSRAVTLKVNKKLPIGRVMTPTLNMVVERDLEIENFKPKTTYELQGKFSLNKNSKDKYIGVWYNEKTGENRFEDKKKAEEFKNKLKKDGIVEKVEKKKERKYAPPNYSLGDLQQDANRIYGFTAKETLGLAQALYENHKILSYPRTESKALSSELGKEIDKHLKAVIGVSEVKKHVDKILADKKIIQKTVNNKLYINDKALTDHHAIIPTKKKADLTRLKDKEKKLYLLVVKRFVSIFLEPMVSNKTTVTTSIDGEKFKSMGSILVSKGFRELYGYTPSDTDLPDIEKGDKVTLEKTDLNQKVTTPPKPYNDATLINAMTNAGKFVEEEELKKLLKESAGLGTVATRDSILEKLIQQKMLERKGKSITSTTFGKETIKLLDGRKIISPELTAEWEQKLRAIEDGEYKADKFKHEMNEYIKFNVEDIHKNINTQLSDSIDKKVLGKCPKCESSIIVGKKYYLCSEYKKEEGKNCDFIIGKEMNGGSISEANAKKLVEGKPTTEISFSYKNKKGGYKAKLIFDKKRQKIGFYNDNKEGPDCPDCSKKTILNSKGIYCPEKSCSFSITSKIKGKQLSEKDLIDLASGKVTSSKTFQWNPKSSSNAKMQYKNGKLNFIFD